MATTWVAELDQLAVLQTYVSNFTELSRFPSVRRDIALLISDKINVSEIQQLIEKTGGELLDSTWLFDVYTGQGVEDGKRSLAFAILWQHPSRTLEDAEIKSGMDNILQVLQDTYQATLRLHTALTKAEMADHLSELTSLNRREAKQMVELFFDEISQALISGEQVKLSGFGNFELRDKRQRPGRNPKTGEEIPISARRVVTFRAGQKFRQRVGTEQID